MKQITLLLTFAAFTLVACAQSPNPIQWTYTAKKIADKTYEVHLTANIQNTWHLYSQTQPEDAINQPTEIVFKKNPLLAFDGKTKEVGKMLLLSEKIKLYAL